MILIQVSCLSAVVRGNIRSVVEDENLRAAVIKVSATRVFRQKYTLFTGNSRVASKGEIRTLLQCGVKPGPGSFLFTGRVHFGEAWLGCAPRYKDFKQAYMAAKAAQQIPCELPVDWPLSSATALVTLRAEAPTQPPSTFPGRTCCVSNVATEAPMGPRVFQRTETWNGLFSAPFQCNRQPSGQRGAGGAAWWRTWMKHSY